MEPAKETEETNEGRKKSGVGAGVVVLEGEQLDLILTYQDSHGQFTIRLITGDH